MTNAGPVIGTSDGPGVPLLLYVAAADGASEEASWNNGSDVSVVVNNVCDAGGRPVVGVAVVTSVVVHPTTRLDFGVMAGAAVAAGLSARRLLLLLYRLMTNSSNFACDMVESVSGDAGCRRRHVGIGRERNI